MSITLRPELETFIAETVRSGAYENADQLIERALELLRNEDDWLRDHKDEISEKIERAFGQFERGEFFTEEESRADMERRKAVWRERQKL